MYRVVVFNIHTVLITGDYRKIFYNHIFMHFSMPNKPIIKYTKRNQNKSRDLVQVNYNT